MYLRVRGEEVSVYDVPKGMGLIEKARGSKKWSGFCWVSPGTVSDMLALLPHVRLWKKDCLRHHIQVIIKNSPYIGAKRTVNGANHE